MGDDEDFLYFFIVFTADLSQFFDHQAAVVEDSDNVIRPLLDGLGFIVHRDEFFTEADELIDDHFGIVRLRLHGSRDFA
ncbi:hypothetical protein D3C73_1419680 [compost metagenome]